MSRSKMQAKAMGRRKNQKKKNPKFRLLTILDTQTPISCRLSVFSFQLAPAYTALFYTWGKSEPSTAISLDGAPFEIGPNLAKFFRNEHCRRTPANAYGLTPFASIKPTPMR
jgi:hypothetical protein